MKRWTPVAVVAVLIFVMNLAGRIYTEFYVSEDDISTQNVLGIAAAGGMALVALIAGLVWSMRASMRHLVAYLGGGLLIGTALAVLIGPLCLGGNPFAGGVDLVLAELVMFFGISVVAAFVGYLITTILGIDHRGKQLKRVESYYGRR